MFRLNIQIDGMVSEGRILVDLELGVLTMNGHDAEWLRLHPDDRMELTAVVNKIAETGSKSAILHLSKLSSSLKLGGSKNYPAIGVVSGGMSKEDTKMSQSAAVKILQKKKGAKVEETQPEVDIDDEEAVAVDELEDADEPAPPKKPAAKKPAAKKEPAKTETKTKVSTGDKIAETAAEIENLTEAATLKEVHDLIESQSFDDFRLGGLFAKIITEEWVGEHPNFKTMVEVEFGVAYRKAMYLVAIYNNLVESGVKWSKVKLLGWTKLKELSQILTQENVDEILESIDGMTAMQVAEFVRDFLRSDGDSEAAAEGASQLKSKTFKLYEGQKETVELALEKAKDQSGTDMDGAALELMAIDFLNSGGTKSKAKKKAADDDDNSTLVEVPTSTEDFVPLFTAIKEATEDDQTSLSLVLEAVNRVWPTYNISVELDDEDDEDE